MQLLNTLNLKNTVWHSIYHKQCTFQSEIGQIISFYAWIGSKFPGYFQLVTFYNDINYFIHVRIKREHELPTTTSQKLIFKLKITGLETPIYFSYLQFEYWVISLFVEISSRTWTKDEN